MESGRRRLCSSWGWPVQGTGGHASVDLPTILCELAPIDSETLPN